VVLIVVRRGTELLQSPGSVSRVLRLSHEPERDFNPDMRITKVDQENSIGWQCIGGDDLGDNTFRFDWSTTSKAHG